jgi:hypothetical protein
MTRRRTSDSRWWRLRLTAGVIPEHWPSPAFGPRHPPKHTLGVSGAATIRARLTGRRQRKREAHAEERSFVSMYDRRSKNRISQSLWVLAMLVTFGGGFLATVSWAGFIVLVVGLVSLITIFLWALRNWD